MAEVRKILGHADVAASTVVTAYDVPASTEAIVSSIVFCNRGTAAVLCAMVITADYTGQPSDSYIYWDLAIPTDDTFVATIGITLSANDQIRVAGSSAAASSVSVNVFGVQIS